MIVRVVGFILAFIGFLMLKYFPDLSEHQKTGFTLSGILIAIILILVGIAMIFFG